MTIFLAFMAGVAYTIVTISLYLLIKDRQAERKIERMLDDAETGDS